MNLLMNESFYVVAIGRLCEKCDGRCVICDSMVRPADLGKSDIFILVFWGVFLCVAVVLLCLTVCLSVYVVHICDDCNYGSFLGRCIICGGKGISDAYYCKPCVLQERDRDGCPKIVNLGSERKDAYYAHRDR